MDFFNVLKKMAEEDGQRSIAQKVGVSQAQLCRWINKRLPPGSDKLRAISDLTGCSVDSIVNTILSDKKKGSA